MSATTTTTPAPVTVTEPTKEDNFLGVNFNNPFVIGGLLLVGIPTGYILINIIKNFLFKEQQPKPPQQRKSRPLNAEELRQLNYQKQLDDYNRRQKLSEEQQYIENIRRYGIINNNNRDLSSYNVHKKQPQQINPELETEIELIDDNLIDYNNIEFNKQLHNKPFFVEPEPHQKPQSEPQPQIFESTKDDDSSIIEMEDNELPNNIPREFTNVGNRPAAFENIQTVPKIDNQQDNEDDVYNLDNFEISEDDLKNMETKAFFNSEYY